MLFINSHCSIYCIITITVATCLIQCEMSVSTVGISKTDIQNVILYFNIGLDVLHYDTYIKVVHVI